MPPEQKAPITLTCLRCGHKWEQRKENPPKKCPACQSPVWFKPRPSPIELFGPPPENLQEIVNPKGLMIAHTPDQLRSLSVDACDALNWLGEALDETQRLVKIAHNFAQRSFGILEYLAKSVSGNKTLTGHLERTNPEEPPPTPEPTPTPPAKAPAKGVHENGRKKNGKK